MSDLPRDVRVLGRLLLGREASEEVLGDLGEIARTQFENRLARAIWLRWELARSVAAVLRHRLTGGLRRSRGSGRPDGSVPGPSTLASVPTGLLADLVQDVRYALVSFRRSPGFTSAVLVTLALGLGGTSSIMATLDAVYAAALPFRDADRLLRLRSYAVADGGDERVYNMPDRDALLIRSEARSLDGVALMRGFDAVVLHENGAERVRGVRVSGGWLEIVGMDPALGRGFTADEAAAGPESGVALVSHALWERQLGGDPAAVGATLPLDGGAVRVVGVMPPRFHYPYDADIWTPLRPDPNNFTGHDLNVIARMAPGASEEGVRAELEQLYARLRADSPGTVVDDGVHVASLRADFIREEGRTAQALLVAVGFLLLLACVNTTNLLTARFVARERELGLRAALGAGRGRQVRQLLTETLLLFAVGGVLGLVLAGALSDFLQVLVPEVLRDQLGVGGGPRPSILLSTLALAGIAGLAFGGAAAVRAGRRDLGTGLHRGGRGTSAGPGRTQDALVVAELALSFVLLVGAAVMVDHFRRLDRADLGYDLADLYTFRISLQHERYAGAAERSDLVRALEQHLRSVPGVVAAGITSVNPLCCGDWGMPLEVEGLERAPDEPPFLIHHRYVTPGYFEAMRIGVVEGAPFPPGENPASARTVVIDEALARRFWSGEDPVGRRIRSAREGEPWRTVVGVVEDVHKEGDYTETWYLPFHQEPLGRSNDDLHVMLHVRSADAMPLARAAVLEVEPNLPPYEVTSMQALRDARTSQDRLGSLVSLAFAAFGILLATFGLYGLLSYLVGLRSREIGTRLALGASRAHVLGTVLRRAGLLVVTGTLVGLWASLGLNALLSRIVPGVQGADALLLLTLVLTLSTVSGLAALVPALRAARVDPARVLQGD